MAIKVVQNDVPAKTASITSALYLDGLIVNNSLSGVARGAVFEWRTIGGGRVASAQDMHYIEVIVTMPVGSGGGSLTVALDNLVCFPTAQCATKG
jgi:hypothetical protein